MRDSIKLAPDIMVAGKIWVKLIQNELVRHDFIYSGKYGEYDKDFKVAEIEFDTEEVFKIVLKPDLIEVHII